MHYRDVRSTAYFQPIDRMIVSSHEENGSGPLDFGFLYRNSYVQSVDQVYPLALVTFVVCLVFVCAYSMVYHYYICTLMY